RTRHDDGAPLQRGPLREERDDGGHVEDDLPVVPAPALAGRVQASWVSEGGALPRVRVLDGLAVVYRPDTQGMRVGDRLGRDERGPNWHRPEKTYHRNHPSEKEQRHPRSPPPFPESSPLEKHHWLFLNCCARALSPLLAV